MAEWRGVAADLSGYIERRAGVLATPMIQMAIADADQRVGEVADQLQRSTDLVAELRRRLEAKERQLTRWQRVTGYRSVSDYQVAQPGRAKGRLLVDELLPAADREQVKAAWDAWWTDYRAGINDPALAGYDMVDLCEAFVAGWRR